MAIGLKKRRRVQLIVIAIFFYDLLQLHLIGFAFKDGIEFFRSPTQVMSEEHK